LIKEKNRITAPKGEREQCRTANSLRTILSENLFIPQVYKAPEYSEFWGFVLRVLITFKPPLMILILVSILKHYLKRLWFKFFKKMIKKVPFYSIPYQPTIGIFPIMDMAINPTIKNLLLKKSVESTKPKMD